MPWDVPTVSGLAGLLLTLLGILGKVTGATKWIWQKVSRSRPSSSALMEIPDKTVILVPHDSANTCRWSMDFFGGRAETRVICETNATNISKYDVQLVGAKMRRPTTASRALILPQADGTEDEQANATIPPQATRTVRLEFAIEGPIVNRPKPFSADVAVIDQFGNEHWLRRVRFRHAPSPTVLSKAS